MKHLPMHSLRGSQYNEATLQTINLGDEAEPRNILVGDN